MSSDPGPDDPDDPTGTGYNLPAQDDPRLRVPTTGQPRPVLHRATVVRHDTDIAIMLDDTVIPVEWLSADGIQMGMSATGLPTLTLTFAALEVSVHDARYAVSGRAA